MKIQITNRNDLTIGNIFNVVGTANDFRVKEKEGSNIVVQAQYKPFSIIAGAINKKGAIKLMGWQNFYSIEMESAYR